MYIELTQDGSKILVNIDTMLFVKPSAIGTSVYVGKYILEVDDSYEEIKDALLRLQGGIVNSVKLKK